MNTDRICYLFFDFDGTVFLNGRIPQEIGDAVRAVQRLGHQIILNTGRSRGGLDFRDEQYAGIRWDGMIFGASDMEYNGVRYHDHLLPDEIAYTWLKYAMEHHLWIAVEGENRYRRYKFDEKPDLFTKEHEDDLRKSFCEVTKDNPLTKISVQNNEREYCPGNGIRAVRQDRYTEFFPDGRDKGVGFLDFCKLYHIPKEQCVCFGDSMNDMAIFEVCPTSVSMKASPQELKNVASYRAQTDFGVAEGIQWLFGEKIGLTNRKKSVMI